MDKEKSKLHINMIEKTNKQLDLIEKSIVKMFILYVAFISVIIFVAATAEINAFFKFAFCLIPVLLISYGVYYIIQADRVFLISMCKRRGDHVVFLENHVNEIYDKYFAEIKKETVRLDSLLSTIGGSSDKKHNETAVKLDALGAANTMSRHFNQGLQK